MQQEWDQLIGRQLPYILLGFEKLPEQSILLPGSFNPFHRGHAELWRAAQKTTGRKGLFELSVSNVDKPSLEKADVEKRLAPLMGRYPVLLSCAPTFAEKAELFPGAWFAMGFDTAIRLLSPRYHDDVPGLLTLFRELKTRFVVAGRLHAGGFQTLDDIEIPAGFEELFISIPEKLFREDISSTKLRKNTSPESCSVGSMSRSAAVKKIKKTPPRLERIFQKYDTPIYFVTFNTIHRRPLLACQEVYDSFVTYAEQNARNGRAIGRFVIMPDHIHLFVRLEKEAKLNDFIRLLKQALTKTLRELGVKDNVWQPGFFDRLMRHSESYHEKWNYVRENPVRAGLVTGAEDWPWQGEVVSISGV